MRSPACLCLDILAACRVPQTNQASPQGLCSILVHLHVKGWVDPAQSTRHLRHDLGPGDPKMAQRLVRDDSHQLCCWSIFWRLHLQCRYGARLLNRTSSADACNSGGALRRCCSLIAVWEQPWMTWTPGGDWARRACMLGGPCYVDVLGPATACTADRHEMAEPSAGRGGGGGGG